MRRRLVGVTLAIAAALAVSAPAQAAKDPLNAFRVKATPENKQRLAAEGFDLDGGRSWHAPRSDTPGAARSRALAPRTASQARQRHQAPGARGRSGRLHRLAMRARTSGAVTTGRRRRQGAVPGALRPARGLQHRQEGHLGKTVPRPRHHRAQGHEEREDAPDNTPSGRALQRDAARARVARRRDLPAHAHCTSSRTTAKDTPDGKIVTPLVDSRELWFLCVSNPDGYEYTFQPENRLWRKNMADNDGDGIRGELGTASTPTATTPRTGAATTRAPRTTDLGDLPRHGAGLRAGDKAMKRALERSTSRSRRTTTPRRSCCCIRRASSSTRRRPTTAIFEALAGNDDESAIADKAFDEETGERDDHRRPVRSRTSRRSSTSPTATRSRRLPHARDPRLHARGREPADDERLGLRVPGRRGRHRGRVPAPPAVLARPRASRPTTRRTRTRTSATASKDFYVDDVRRLLRRSAAGRGDRQAVARRRASCATASTRAGCRQAPTRRRRAASGSTTSAGVYYHRLRGVVEGTEPGDEVEVWFEAGGQQASAHFTYTARRRAGDKVLVLAAEDYLGRQPGAGSRRPALPDATTPTRSTPTASATTSTTSTARGHRAPDPLGVLSHYDAVIWYTGDDYLTRRPGQPRDGHGAARGRGDDRCPRHSSTRAASCSTPASAPACSTPEGNEFRNFGFPEPDGAPRRRGSA